VFVSIVIFLCCCDWKSRAAYVQSFALWQQATMEIMRCNLSYYWLLAPRIYIFVLRTFRSWLITESTQHHWRGCNSALFFLVQ